MRRLFVNVALSVVVVSSRHASDAATQRSPLPVVQGTEVVPHQTDVTGKTLSYIAMDSPLSYPKRLTSGAFHSATDLIRSPYAPHPIRVLVDLLRHYPEKVTPIDAAAAVTSAKTRLAQAMDQWQETGDFLSQKALDSEMQQALFLERELRSNNDGEKSSDDRKPLIDVIGDADVLNAVVRGQVGLAAITGQWEVAVTGLYHLLESGSGEAASLNLYRDVLLSCKMTHNYNAAKSVFKLAIQRWEENRSTPLEDLVIPLAQSLKGKENLEDFRHMFVETIAPLAPPSVPLYTAIIAACARTDKDDHTRLPFALSMYRTLRDSAMLPSPDTYAALIDVCATIGDPTKGFAMFHEAKRVHGRAALPPALYTALLRGYVEAGFFEDARKTFDVLVASGVMLNRNAFHVLISGAKDETDALEIVDIMVREPFHMVPTSTTFAKVIDAHAKIANMEDSILFLFDTHVRTVQIHELIAVDSQTKPQLSAAELGRLDPAHLQVLDKSYSEAMENVLMRIGVHGIRFSRPEAEIDDLRHRLAMGTATGVFDVWTREDERKYKETLLLRDMIRAVCKPPQLRMNDFIGFAPQTPTQLPVGAYVAVLGPASLGQWRRFFQPIAKHFSSIVVPYSSLVACRRADSSPSAKENLQAFFKQFKTKVHLVSLEEEMDVSYDLRRFGIQRTKLHFRPLGFAACLAKGHTMCQLYKNRAANVYYIGMDEEEVGQMARNAPSIAEVVTFHNPEVHPNWTPPVLQSSQDVRKAGTARKGIRSLDVGRPAMETKIFQQQKESVIEPELDAADLFDQLS